MRFGRIIKALSGFYYVQSDQGVYQCRGRGNFRKRKLIPLVGDIVDFEADNKDEGYILEIRGRKNELNRPPISNVDQAMIVFSAVEPDFSSMLLDRFLVHIEANDIKPLIIISKVDLISLHDMMDIENYAKEYRNIGYDVILMSSKTGAGSDILRPFINNKTTVFAGQSGVGKSSLLNMLDPALSINTAKISLSLGRGKHTTRHVELIPIGTGFVADTPGFSSLEFINIESVDLSHYFPEMVAQIDNCKFRGCTHSSEPGCAVKQAVNQGEIPQYRYNHYIQFLGEIKNQKRRY